MSRASGSIELIGSVAYVYETRPRLLLSDKIFRLLPRRTVLSEYLSILLGAGFVRLQIEYLHDNFNKIKKLMTKAQEAIDLMREHRTALISAAVTGKIDVRGWQRPDTESQETATAVNA